MSFNEQFLEAGRCPLCGRPNECQLCAGAGYKGSCWCAEEEIPEALLAEVPAELRNRACVCHECIVSFRLKPRPAN
jgi:hypothetical protein